MGTNKFAIRHHAADWCAACGNSTGICAAYSGYGASNNGIDADEGGGGSGVSKAVPGVIGAMVTLAAVLGVQVGVMALAGLRLVRDKKENEEEEKKQDFEG